MVINVCNCRYQFERIWIYLKISFKECWKKWSSKWRKFVLGLSLAMNIFTNVCCLHNVYKNKFLRVVNLHSLYSFCFMLVREITRTRQCNDSKRASYSMQNFLNKFLCFRFSIQLDWNFLATKQKKNTFIVDRMKDELLMKKAYLLLTWKFVLKFYFI
jgi:hypothetical protein